MTPGVVWFKGGEMGMSIGRDGVLERQTGLRPEPRPEAAPILTQCHDRAMIAAGLPW
jgi:hypothetical protein